MPTVHMIGAIKIDVYPNDHLPPHFHAIYGEERALIEIETLTIYAGSIPVKQLRAVREWAKGDGIQSQLMEHFKRWNPRLFRQR